MFFVSNLLIYLHVRSSTNRIHPQDTSKSVQNKKLYPRDGYLLRHMVFMFCIFVGGWAPVFLLPIINDYVFVNAIVDSSFTIFCEVAAFIDMIDLFLYNHEVRKYLLLLIKC